MTEIERIAHFAQRVTVEAEGLLALLSMVDDAQWTVPPSERPNGDVQIRNTSGAIDDPVGNTVADPARLALRDQVRRSERLMKDALVKVAGVRRGLEIRMVQWEGSRSAARPAPEAPVA